MTALLLGASGLTGGLCLQELMEDPTFDKVITPLRKEMVLAHPKLEQVIINFDKIVDNQDKFRADVVFCCLGTTIRKAGSKEIFKKIDYEYPLLFAQLALKQGATTFVLVSAMGAATNSLFFYSRVKGELESELKKLGYQTLIILQPSLLLGDRKEQRLGEDVAKIFSPIFNFFTPKKYKAIHAEQVAKAMVKLAKQGLNGLIVKESDEIKEV
ncbi:MAG: oxidoreductase [Cytophagales bacterium]|nr:MAG: oxidoreductase [Cytophagales bacterium]